MKIPLLVAVMVPLWACGDTSREPSDPPDALRQQVADLYERARESGEEVSGDVYEWAREDVESIGDWQYRVVERDDADAEALETQLNELGTERWEVVWIERRGARLRLYLKRPTRSYLRHLPLSELPRLIPGAGE